jgi:hypothetical protein
MLATSSSTTATIIPFPSRGLPGQSDLFLTPEATVASTGVTGLAVRMIHRACRNCNSTMFIIGSSAAMHHASLRCAECDAHAGWMSRGAYTFVQMTIAKFGAPTEPITVRHSDYEEGF